MTTWTGQKGLTRRTMYPPRDLKAACVVKESRLLSCHKTPCLPAYLQTSMRNPEPCKRHPLPEKQSRPGQRQCNLQHPDRVLRKFQKLPMVITPLTALCFGYSNYNAVLFVTKAFCFVSVHPVNVSNCAFCLSRKES